MPAGLLLLAGLLSLGAQLYVFPADVSKDDWKEPAAYVKEHFVEGDLIRVHPSWTEDPLPYLTDLGSALSRQHRPVAGDIDDARRIWILSETDRVAEAIDRLPYAPSRPDKKSFGNVTVVRTRVPSSAKSSYNLLERLEDAKVERIKKRKKKDDKVTTCSNWNEKDRRWDCGKRDPWLYVGEEYRFFHDDAHRCIWAHPLPGNKRLRITYPNVPLDRELRIRAGFTFKAGLKQKGKDVHMKVSINGEQRAKKRFGKNTSAWELTKIDTPELTGKTAPVAIEIWTRDITDRFFCLDGWVR